MDTAAALELLLPSFLHFVGIASSALLSVGAVSAWLQLPRPRRPGTAVPIICLSATCIGTLFALLLWTEGLHFGDNTATRFNTLCQSAGLRIHRRLTGAQGVLVETSELEKYVHYGDMGPPSPAALLATANVQVVEHQTITSGNARYVRFSRPTAMTQVEDSLADVVVKMKTIASQGEMKAGIYGEEMLITERASGQTLASFRYFWTTPRPVASCPKPKQGINTSQIVSYVVGLKDSALEERWREAFIP